MGRIETKGQKGGKIEKVLKNGPSFVKRGVRYVKRGRNWLKGE